jgi:hypothetical protein
VSTIGGYVCDVAARGRVSCAGDGSLKWVALCLVIASLLVPSSAGAYPGWWLREAACIHSHEGGWHERLTYDGRRSWDHGGYQIDVRTWAHFAPRSWPRDPADASSAQQTFVAWLIWQSNGRRWGRTQWPSTSRICGVR